MQKISTLIGLSVISISLIGMETNNQKVVQKQPNYTVSIMPIGGYLETNFVTQDICADYGLAIHNNAKIIHFKIVKIKDKNGNRVQPDSNFKVNLIPTVPLDIFTEENKEYTTSSYPHVDQERFIAKLICKKNKIYTENDFVTYNEYGKKNI